MSARKHHYLSQFYLRGFTDGESKNSKMVVIDMKEGRSFKSPTSGVGALRDFNRIDVAGEDPNVLEEAISEFETQAASSVRKVKHGGGFDGDDKANLLHLIAMFAIRSPARRENWRKLMAEVAEHTMQLVLANKERYEYELKRAREAGAVGLGGASYEDMKRFVDSKAYSITLAREEHIRTELIGIDAILPFLFARRWFLVRATDETGPFISSDYPVSLTWINPESVPAFYRDDPGYGMQDTRVTFPLSQRLALVGEFESDGLKGVGESLVGSRSLVAKINATTAKHALRQLYAPQLGFAVVVGGQVQDGRSLLRLLGERKS